MNQQKRPSAIKKIRATGAMREVMAEYFGELDVASRTGSEKIAWCTSVGPAELLGSFVKVPFVKVPGTFTGAFTFTSSLLDSR